MSELFLIAHCVRGEAAFDVAVQMECPLCVTSDYHTTEGCFECDQLGYWWIIPTSGHRAYPYWHCALNLAVDWEMCRINGHELPEMPPVWPDHYRNRTAPKLDITSLFRAAQPQQPRIARRL